MPVYDLALKLIEEDSEALKKEVSVARAEVQALEAEVRQLEGQGSEVLQTKEQELEGKRQHLEILEIQSEVNLPSVRFAVESGHADLTRPSHRKMVETKWRNEGDLDLLMERVSQMNIVPDVIPTFHPSFNLRCSFVTPESAGRRTYASEVQAAKAKGREPPPKSSKSRALVEAGVYLSPAQTIDPPTMFTEVFHTDTRLYTLVMIDPDVPDVGNQTYQNYLHWMCPNIPLSASHKGPVLVRELVPDHTKYVPPHPQRGTPYHRYILLLLPQPSARSGFIPGATDINDLPAPQYTYNQAAATPAGVPTSMALDIPVVADEERLGFDVRQFVRHWGLNLGKEVGEKEGGGAFIWREVWDESVAGIYKRFLGAQQEPVYGRPRRVDPYQEAREQLAQQSRYMK